jgi:predicted RNA-binding protein with TRAM domain
MDEFELPDDGFGDVFGYYTRRREPLEPIPLNEGERFNMALVGVDRSKLYFGWSKPPGHKGKHIRVRIGKEGEGDFGKPQRVEEYEGGAQCGDVVLVEITKLAERSAFARVIENVGCCFERVSDADGKFEEEYQVDREGRPRKVVLTGHSITDARNAVSLGGDRWRAGFRGVTTIVRKARYSERDFSRECEVKLLQWRRGHNGKYVITADPVKDEDKRDVRKEIWIARMGGYDFRRGFSQEWSELTYNKVYDLFKGFPKGLDNILFFDGPDRMQILYDGGETDISGRPVQNVVNDFYRQIRPYRFRLVVATTGSLLKLKDAIGNSECGLSAEYLPSHFSKDPYGF